MSAARERLYWDAGRSKLVGEGDPEAAFLAVAEGDDLQDFPEVQAKMAGKAANKQAAKPENK